MRFRLADRRVLKLGPAAASFVNAYSTQTPESPRAAFLDLKGRIVAVADQALLPSGEADLAVGAGFIERLQKHLKPYLFLTGNTLTEEPGLFVYFDSGKIVMTAESLPDTISADEFTRWRVEHRRPLQGIDFDEEPVLNVADETLVSFTKGCYLGQEIVARVHYRGKPPRRLEVVDAGARPDATSRARMPDGRLLGFAFVENR
jgi:folate-binding protein YgfZ